MMAVVVVVMLLKLKPTLMGISETKAGITQFINPNITGFSGLLKHYILISKSMKLTH